MKNIFTFLSVVFAILIVATTMYMSLNELALTFNQTAVFLFVLFAFPVCICLAFAKGAKDEGQPQLNCG